MGGEIGWGSWERLPRRLYSQPFSPALAERSTADQLLGHSFSIHRTPEYLNLITPEL